MKEHSVRVVGRLAPSPTGALHLGNIRTFMVTWLLARSANGHLVMRIEDLDHPKNKPGAVNGMLADLRWLGFDWDEGYGCGCNDQAYIQSKRVIHYAQALEKLKALNLVYPCVCSRSDVEAGLSAPHSEECLHYNGLCRDRFGSFDAAVATLPAGRVPAWRFKVSSEQRIGFVDRFCGVYSQIPAEVSGDFVLARQREGGGYMLAVVVDDNLMGINQVVRGDDLLSATPRQILIHQALDLPLPEYVHLPLVVGVDGRRLAKRHGDTRIAALRAEGISAERIIGFLAASCGWAQLDEEIALSDLLPRFNLQSIPRTPFVWDGKL